jgi:hypothetical protein
VGRPVRPLTLLRPATAVDATIELNPMRTMEVAEAVLVLVALRSVARRSLPSSVLTGAEESELWRNGEHETPCPTEPAPFAQSLRDMMWRLHHRVRLFCESSSSPESRIYIIGRRAHQPALGIVATHAWAAAL